MNFMNRDPNFSRCGYFHLTFDGPKEFGNDRVTRWTPRRGAIAADGRGWLGEVVAGGQGYGDDLEQLAGPTALTLQERGGMWMKRSS